MSQQAPHPQGAAADYLARAQRRIAVEAARVLFRRRLAVRTALPLVSFTFDDFPRSAFLEAGSILMRYGVLGTYYVSLSLMGKQSHLGPMFQEEDLKELTGLGHELGCHTFGHCHSWNTPRDVYERAILENQKALSELLPGASFQTFAYPISGPRLAVKKVAGRHFLCCRGGGLKVGRYLRRHAAGGQTFNSGITDLDYLCAFFLEKSRGNPEAVESLIGQNARARGWLIFATHDVCESPSPYGCTSDFFEQVVRWAVDSGACILPVARALETLLVSSRASAAETAAKAHEVVNTTANVIE
jgi:peptidoglycan/xylan/chitin deacetylase (PgdA/CDA1 family)